MQIYINDIQVYSCIYNPTALLRPLQRVSAGEPRELPSYTVNSHHNTVKLPSYTISSLYMLGMAMLILSICKYMKLYVVI
jgi:hypothetical protein